MCMIDSSIIYSLSSGIKGVRIRTWVPNTDTPLFMELKD